MKFVLCFIGLFSLNAFTKECVIKTFPHIIKINRLLDSETIQESNCSDEINNRFVNILSTATGSINSKHLGPSLGENVTIRPKKITITALAQLIEKKLGGKTALSNLSSLHSKSFFYSKEKPKIQVMCKSCDSPGTKNIKFIFNSRTYWLNATVKRKVVAYVADQNLSYQTPLLKAEDLKKTSIHTLIKAPLFSDIENIKFYRPTRNISAGEILKMNDLRPKNIIKRGQKIKVLIKNKRLKVETIAKALKNGKFGDYIEIINPKSKKTNLAKVIDYNKVLIEL